MNDARGLFDLSVEKIFDFSLVNSLILYSCDFLPAMSVYKKKSKKQKQMKINNVIEWSQILVFLEIWWA